MLHTGLGIFLSYLLLCLGDTPSFKDIYLTMSLIEYLFCLGALFSCGFYTVTHGVCVCKDYPQNSDVLRLKDF